MTSDCVSHENFEYGYPHSNALLQSHPFGAFRLHLAAHHQKKCGVVTDVNPFLTQIFEVIQSDVALQNEVH